MTTPVVLITHGGAGQAMLSTVEQLVGPLGVTTAELEVSAGSGVMESTIRDVSARLQGRVLYLVDLDGSTPCRLCAERGVVLTGVNLPMLMKLATVDRERSPEELAEELMRTGQRSILLRNSGATH